MKNKPINVFFVDDEFPVDEEFRSQGVYNRPISQDNLFHLAVTGAWNHLKELQQLIKDIITNEFCQKNQISLTGFSTPTQVLSYIEKNKVYPDVIIYDWEYPNATLTSNNSQKWLLEILDKTIEAKTFIFVYSKRRNELPRFLNVKAFNKYSGRFQLLLKGGKIQSSFAAEEFIFQYILGLVADQFDIKINGIPIEFTSNKFLKDASDILFLQRIIGKQNFLEGLNDIGFRVNDISVEKMLNESNKYLLYSEIQNVLINPDEKVDLAQFDDLTELSYAEVIERFSISTLEEALERGFLKI